MEKGTLKRAFELEDGAFQDNLSKIEVRAESNFTTVRFEESNAREGLEPTTLQVVDLLDDGGAYTRTALRVVVVGR